jgi:DNA-binding Lrp family transcriptional regulator
MLAYVLLKVEVGAEKKVTAQLSNIGEFKEAFVLFGDYDYIIELEAPSIQELARIVTHKIRRIRGVEKTITLLEAPAEEL